MTASRRGRLIAVEGIDGCGKSTQARILADALGAELTHEPGATDLGRTLRRLALEPSGPAPVARAEALLMAADRAQHVEEVIRPALDAGRWVVTDRYSGSTLAYQGSGRGLPLGALGQMLEWASDGLDPDITVLVDVPIRVARHRLGEETPDRLERLDPAFHERVRQGYLALAGGDGWVVIDGTPDVDSVATAIGAAVSDRLGGPGASERRA